MEANPGRGQPPARPICWMLNSTNLRQISHLLYFWPVDIDFTDSCSLPFSFVSRYFITPIKCSNHSESCWLISYYNSNLYSEVIFLGILFWRKNNMQGKWKQDKRGIKFDIKALKVTQLCWWHSSIAGDKYIQFQTHTYCLHNFMVTFVFYPLSYKLHTLGLYSQINEATIWWGQLQVMGMGWASIWNMCRGP